MFVYRLNEENSEEKLNKLKRGPQNNELKIRVAYYDNNDRGVLTYAGVMLVPKIYVITLEACIHYYNIACQAFKFNPDRIDFAFNGVEVVYLADKNIMRIFEYAEGTLIPIYENNNGHICDDRTALYNSNIYYSSK